ncbi:MAG TPA: phenylacetic acid degradation protein PaaN [Steroidobacteraceae bacterium]|nr:phenylacetic acid degradation protein PaaN [Steroidobacteraceae bacterium]
MNRGERLGRDLFERHSGALTQAVAACHERGYFTLFPETPDRHRGGDAAAQAGLAAFQAQLGQRFELEQPGTVARIGHEVSPYTQDPLGIDYPCADVDALFTAASDAIGAWATASPHARLGVCMEIVDRLYDRTFEIAQAVMHTAGQSGPMSYAGSGTNALDRGVEALAYAHEAMLDIPPEALWERRFGSTVIRLRKRYRLVPRGVTVCFACATFPTWNAYPAMLASLATGNAVIVKPHPTAILPMALAVRTFREVIAAAGFDANLVTLCPDTLDEPIGKRLVRHPRTAIVDFTGSARFGAWVEANAHPALCFTETSGVNTVVVESVDALEPVLKSLATTMSLFSAQMCTSPQNVYVPGDGVRHAGVRVTPEEFGERLAGAIAAIGNEPKRAAPIMAALQSPSTAALLDEFAGHGSRRGRVLLESAPYAHPDFPRARTRTPLLLGVEAGAHDLYGEERFGPVGFVIRARDRDDALAQAATDAKRGGGITAFVYSTDGAYLERAVDAYSASGAQLTCNLTGPMPLNFAAAYSDYHVTGMNPAGNATLTDLAFVASRFRITQSREPA